MLRLAFSTPVPALLRGTSGFATRSPLRRTRVSRPAHRCHVIRLSSTAVEAPKIDRTSTCEDVKAPLTFQDAVRVLQDYWARAGCILWQPCNTEVGAGTMNPATYLRVLGPEPWRVAYEEPSLRPDDSRFGENPNRLQRHTQFQVIVKPAPVDAQQLVLGSYRALGIDVTAHDVRFVEDNWQSPALGAWGLGWEVWLDGMEVTQFTYFQQAGGLPLDSVAVEVTYGLERIVMALQGVSHFRDITFAPGVTYGEIFLQSEYEMSRYNLDDADIARNANLFDQYEAEAVMLLDKRLPVPAYSYLLKASHTFNILDARGAVGVTERARFFQRMRKLARDVAKLWLERREELQFPLLAPLSERRAPIPAANLSAIASFGERERFVFEIGVEELPPEDLDSMMAQVESLVGQVLHNASLIYDNLSVNGTPRRVAIVVDKLQTKQKDTREQVRGPPLRIARDEDGKLSRAALGFLNKLGVTDDACVEYIDGYMYATVERKGKSATEVLAASLATDVLSKVSFGKTMRWNDSRVAFSRPIRWLFCMIGQQVVPVEFAGVQSGSHSRSLRGGDGHASEVEITSANDYESELRKHHIVLCAQERRKLIAQGAERLSTEVGGRWVCDEGLLDEVVNLVENPMPIVGRFNSAFLNLPDEVLVTVMKKHQRYFPVADPTTGSLLNAFITVVNGNASLVDLPAIRSGNEAVLRARYADASFFYENDTKDKSLADFVPLLERLAFQEKLGSMLDKTNRIVCTVPAIGIAMNLSPQDHSVALSAAKLAKADLATSMVIEMTSLAGVMGKHYAERSGEVTQSVCDAIFEGSLPRFSGDNLPQSLAGAAVAVADRLDSLVALFGIGLAPKSTADPFALRRAALGVVQTLISCGVDVGVDELVRHAGEPLENKESQEAVINFIEKRLEAFLIDSCDVPLRPDVVKAVLGVTKNRRNPFIAYETALALQRALDTHMELVEAAAATHGRAARLLKSVGSAAELANRPVDVSLFECEQETALFHALEAVNTADSSVEAKLEQLGRLKCEVDSFFENVFVNVDDQLLRDNRITLSARVVAIMQHNADLMLLQI